MQRIISIVFLALFLTACMTGGGSRARVDSLERAINQYGQALRWARYTDAIGFHVDREGNALKVEMDRLEHIRITGYEITERTVDPDLAQATIKGEFNYYLTSEGTLQKLSVEQDWWYDEKLKAWFLASGFPEFR